MNLNYLKVFVTVASQGSLKAASKKLGIPNSTLSRHLQQFESELGKQQIQRNTRHLRLTDDGKELYLRTESIIAELDEVEHQISESNNHLSGKIILGIPSEFGVKWLNSCIAEFAAQHPDISIECITSMAPLDPVRRDVDVSISYLRGRLKDSGLVIRSLLKLPSVVVASPKLIKKHGLPSTVKELSCLPCISTLTALQANPWQFIDNLGSLLDIEVEARYKVDSSRMLISGAISGVGYAIIPEPFCKSAIIQGKLVVIDLDMKPAPLEIVSIYPNHSVSLRLEKLMELITFEFRNNVGISF
jgi:DNA-binding transcriptional LysR family regulator